MTPKLTAKQQIEVAGHLSQSAAAWLLRITARTLRDQDAPRNADGSYSARDIVRWVQSTSSYEDPMLAGADSPNLERFRAAKAELAEMDADERRGQLVDVDVLSEWWATEVAAPMRRAVEGLQLRFGPDAAALITTALDNAEAAIEKRGQADA